MTLSYMRRVLFVGPDPEGVGRALKEEGLEVHAIVGDAALEDARSYFDSATCARTQVWPFAEGYFDCILLNETALLAECLVSSAGKVLPLLSEWGAVYISTPEGAAEALALLPEMGLQYYAGWRINEGGVSIMMGDGERASATTVMAVRSAYDPLPHARALFKSHGPLSSLEVLTNIPEHLLADPETLGYVYAEKQLCMLAYDRKAGEEDRISRFATAQRAFYDATNRVPHCRQAYMCHAEFWRTMGDEDMAARLMRNINHVAPEEGAGPQDAPRGVAERREEMAPVWEGHIPAPNILFICHDFPDFGLDTLNDGLCTVLGPEHLFEFPWKPTLHGHAPTDATNYPCTFDHPGEPRDIQWVRQRLHDGFFDLVFYADTLRRLDRDMVRALMPAVGDTPFFIIDTWDEAGDYLKDLLAYTGRESALAYFKREMLACGRYPPNTFPMPFSYADMHVPADISGQRTDPLFWAGKCQDGGRRLYLEYLAGNIGLDVNRWYTPEEYAHIDHALMGLNFFGLGFDTVRYWELPAHGCMLLSERSPLRLPHNYREGESAVFFGDLPELEEKLEYYLDHPGEAAAIGRQGHKHFKRHHTASARARQLLGYVEQVVREGR